MNNKTVVAFGEIMLRLTPPDAILNAAEYAASYGGSESNVLVALSSLGNATRYITKLPDNDLGRGAVLHLQRYGVDCRQVISAGDNMGMYFFEPGFAARAAKVIYARKHAEITTLQETDFDYDQVFADCGLFHISGISFALSPSVEATCFRLLKEAKKRHIPVSFDFNYRAKLWTVERAAKVFQQIIPYADIVLCSQRDLDAFLQISREDFFTAYGNVACLVVREREILSKDAHKIRAAAYTKTGLAAQAEKDFAVLERIGGGDAFAAGIIHGWLNFAGDMVRTLEFAMACIALKHTVRGDVLAARSEEIETSDFKDVRR